MGGVQASKRKFAFTVPGAAQTRAYRVNSAGEIVGIFVEAGFKAQGFFRTAGGTFITIDVPSATETWANAIDDAGQIVGYFRETDYKEHGFVTTR